MSGIVLYGTGSPVIVDVEESLHRAGLTLAAGIRNRPGACHLSEPARGLAPDAAGPGLRALHMRLWRKAQPGILQDGAGI